MPSLALLGSDDVDHAAQRVRAEAHGHHAFVDLDALGIVHRQVVEVQGLPRPLLRHTVDEDLDVAATKAVQHQLHVRAHAAALAQFHAWCLGQRVAQGLGRVVQLGGIHGHGIVGGTLHAAYAGSGDHHLVQLAMFGAESEVLHEALAAAQGDFFFYRLIADGRDHQGVRSSRGMETIAALGIDVGTVRSSLQVDTGKVYGFVVGGSDAAAQLNAVGAMVAAAMLGLCPEGCQEQ